MRDVRGRADKIAAPKGSFEAFLAWEFLQRGVAHNYQPMTEAEIELLCGVDKSWIKKLKKNALSHLSEYNILNG